MNEEKKRILKIGILVILLFVIFFSTLTLKGKENASAEGQKNKEKRLSVVLQEAEEHFAEVKKRTQDIDNMKKTPELNLVRKDPFNPIKRKIDVEKVEKIIREEEKKEITFLISGIVYDEQKPMVIIGDNVKCEGEYIEEYQIYKIFPDSILLKNGNDFYELKMNFEEMTKNT